MTITASTALIWESLSEHGSATFRLLFCGLILNDIPMLREYPGLDTHDICGTLLLDSGVF